MARRTEEYYWILVENTVFELPLYVAETVKELSEFLGVKESVIRCKEFQHRNKGVLKSNKGTKVVKVLRGM